jgi:hypothetical protein
MDLTFERGRADEPTGHALVYFRDPADGAVLATYVVVLPIALNLTKYVPPMIAAQLPLADVQGVGAVPLPPVPEPVESHAYLERLAALRRDDLIAAGTTSQGDFARLMTSVGEVAQRYAQLYEDHLARAPAAPASEPADEPVGDTSVNDVIYQLMSEQQKLGELTKLTGQLRYAVDGGDQRQAEEAIGEMERLGRYLPAHYDVAAFVEAARRPGPIGHQLSALYLDRFYKLSAEDYAAIEQIDREIQRLRSDE